MRINEILEALIPKDVSVQTYDTPFNLMGRDRDQRQNADKFGTFSGGEVDPDDPHTFNLRTTGVPASKDPQFLYKREIENIKGDNFWLPVVYKTVLHQDPGDDEAYPEYKMETAQEYHTVPAEAMAAFCDNLISTINFYAVPPGWRTPNTI